MYNLEICMTAATHHKSGTVIIKIYAQPEAKPETTRELLFA